jgi:hypothetical protein
MMATAAGCVAIKAAPCDVDTLVNWESKVDALLAGGAVEVDTPVASESKVMSPLLLAVSQSNAAVDTLVASDSKVASPLLLAVLQSTAAVDTLVAWQSKVDTLVASESKVDALDALDALVAPGSVGSLAQTVTVEAWPSSVEAWPSAGIAMRLMDGRMG